MNFSKKISLAISVFLLILFFYSFYLLVLGTTRETSDRYVATIEMWPGFLLMNFIAIAFSVLVCIAPNDFFKTIREKLKKKLNNDAANKSIKMFALISLSYAIYSSTRGVAGFYGQVFNMHFFGVLINISLSLISATGLFAWCCYFILTRRKV